MTRFFYIFTQWKICLLFSLLFMGCDNTENPNRFNDPITQEVYDIKELFARGINEEKEDLKNKAQQKASRLIERHPNDASVIELESSIYKYLNDPLTREIYRINELAYQGAVQEKESLKNEALGFASELIKLHPNNVDVLRLRSTIYSVLGKSYEALIDLEKSNQIDPSGATKFNECMLRDELPNLKKDSNLSEACFQEASRLIEKSLNYDYPESNVIYIMANILAGNKDKVSDYFEGIVAEERKKNGYLGAYEAIAQEYFGKTLDELFPPKNK